MAEGLVPLQSTMDQALELMIVETEASKEHLDVLLGMRKALLPIEQNAKEDLDKRIEDARQDVHQNMIGFPRLSLEPLKWRHASGLPKLVLMSLNDVRVSFEASYQHGTEYTSINLQYPPKVRECYEDVLNHAKSFCWRNGAKMTYTFEFNGLIPDHARISIAEAIKSGKFDSIWLLVESPEKTWQTTRTKAISRRKVVKEKIKSIELDPVVIGQAHDALFVVDRFDLTTVEQYVVDEFSQLALPPGD